MTNTVEHTYMLNAIEIVEFSSYSAKKFLIVARASDLLTESANPIPRTVLPIHANLREPSAKSIAVKAILTSIEKDLFHEISDPIQVACKSVKQYLGKPVSGKPQERGLFMQFDNVTDGVMDGAHRLHALWLAKANGFNLDNVRVTLMVSEGVDIKAKCLELNTYSAPTKIALMDKNGNFDHIKTLYADSFPFIRYHDNQSGTSDHPLCAVRNIDMLLRRCTGKTIQSFSKQSRGALGADKTRAPLSSGVNPDIKYWDLLHDIYPTLVSLFELFEKAAIAQESRFLLVPRNANLYAQLMDGRKFAVKVSSQQLIYLLMSALSVNFNQETGSWNVPLKKIGKTLIKAAWQEFKEKHTQKRFHGSASAVIADPRMAELILSAADLAYAKYVDRGSDTLAA
jgi:hypothetical protein